MKQQFNIVVPMAGRGSRFTEQGYTDSKPFIDVNGKPMIQRVIENLNIEFDSNYEFVIICLQEDFDKYDFRIFDDIIGHTQYKVICLEDVTEGASTNIVGSKRYHRQRYTNVKFQYRPNDRLQSRGNVGNSRTI